MILACNHIDKSFSEDIILKDVSFHINDGERVALIGVNGAGKTTLLRILVGELPADNGEVTRAKDTTYGYLPQQQGYHSDQSIYDELLAVKQDIIDMDVKIRDMEDKMTSLEGTELEKVLEQYHRMQTAFENNDGYAYKSKVLGVIHGLGFDDDSMYQCINNLSGGQKTRVALGKLLLMEPDLLILDEPTNHLDLESIRWLENYLVNYKGSVLVVSHDRYFLDKVVTKVVEIERGDAVTYSGDYTDYSKKKAMIRNEQIRHYYNQQQEIKHQKEVIDKLRSFNREKSIRRAESREKMLQKMEPVEKPILEEDVLSFSLHPYCMSGQDVLTVTDYEKSYSDEPLFSRLSFDIKRGDKVAIIGCNGTGKTTILKMICGIVSPDAGSARAGANVEIGYYDQEHQVLHDEKTIFEEIQDDYPDMNHTQIRNTLAAFLFTGDDVFKPISRLSGGEKGRVSLAKLMLSEANFLLLDEPTNHLDITSREILEQALINYTGTVLYVSHDRYFINRTATRIFELTDRKMLIYNGDYQYYLEQKDAMEKRYLDNSDEKTRDNVKSTSVSKLDWQEQKKLTAKKRKIQNECKKAEDLITTYEEEISSLDKELSSPEYAFDAGKLTELTNMRNAKDEALSKAMERWEELEKELEDFND